MGKKDMGGNGVQDLTEACRKDKKRLRPVECTAIIQKAKIQWSQVQGQP